MRNTFITVKSFSTRIEAEIARGLLKVNKIDSIIAADDVGGMKPFLVFFKSGVKLKVAAKDLKLAKQIIEKRYGKD